MPSAVAGLDWSADAATAMVGRLVEAVGQADRWTAQVVEELIRVVDTGATEATLGVAVELVLSQTCRAAGFERRTLLTAGHHAGPDARHPPGLPRRLDLVEPGPRHRHRRRPGRPSLLVTCSLDTLLDGTVPGWILTGMAGRIQATSDTIRRWVDAHGADCRLVIMDDIGEVVGVGRRQRFARGWLRDAIIARDLHDTAPCSTTPAMHRHVDHILDWDRHGRTDIDNLTLLSSRWNQAKRRRDWTLQRHPDGTRTWTAASGYRIRQPRPPHLRRATDQRQPGARPPDPGPSP